MKGKKRNYLGRSRLVALSLAAIVAVGLSTTAAFASEAEPSERLSCFTSSFESGEELHSSFVFSRARNTLSLYNVTNKSVYAYTRKNINLNGRSLSVKGITVNGIEYIPYRQAANTLGAAYNYNSLSKTSTMTLSGLTMTATSGNYVIYANDRPLFSISPTLIMSDGRMYIPLDVFTKAVGMKSSVGSSEVKISGNLSPLLPADNFYRADEVLWLSRIIHAESRGEPLLGQIAVGNVVLNRVRSSSYPNTIYGVIFDRKYGVQFSPVLDGTIYNTPCYNSTLAAKICLEGFDISGGALFFLRPELSTSSWIPNSRPYAFSIGKHDFYK